MKAGTQNHIKTKRLKRLLKIPLYRAVGILETIWLLCADCCDEGNIGKFSDEEIADYLEWDGDVSDLVRALSDSGWTDSDKNGRPVIHDWIDHCPEYIRDRIRKRNARSIARNIGKIEHDNPNDLTTYVSDKPDKTGQNRTDTGQAAATTVYSQPNPTQPNQYSGPDRKPNRTEVNGNGKEVDQRSATIQSFQSLRESCAIAIDPLPVNSLKGGAFKPLRERHLRSPQSVYEWYRRQLSLPDPVCENSRADLLLVIATALYVVEYPEAELKKNRVAFFNHIIKRRLYRMIGEKHIDKAVEIIVEIESREKQAVQ